MPDTGDLRERLFDTLEEAVDRLGDLVDDRPGALDLAAGARRHSRLSDLGLAAVVAAAPAVYRAAHERLTRPSTPTERIVALVPVAVTRRPLLVGGGVVAGVAAGFLLARALRRRRAAERGDEQQLLAEHDEYTANSGAFDIDQEVARMQGEGGAANGSGEHAQAANRRRFARSGGTESDPR